MSSKLINVKKIIEISSTCIETYPCKHYITYETKDGNIHNNCLSMPVIFQLCLELKYKTPPHIEEEYLEWKSQPPQVDKQPASITNSCTIN